MTDPADLGYETLTATFADKTIQKFKTKEHFPREKIYT